MFIQFADFFKNEFISYMLESFDCPVAKPTHRKYMAVLHL